MTNLTNKLNNKGSMSILYVILILTAAIMILGFMSIIMKSITMNEIQGILDTSGVAALRYGVDDVAWRAEELIVDKSMAKSKFIELVNRNITPGKLIKDFKLKEVNIYSSEEVPRSLGISGGSRDQYFLEAIAMATYKSEPMVDAATFNGIRFFDFLRTNKKEGVSVSGKAGDGNVEVIIRSVSRLVMR